MRRISVCVTSLGIVLLVSPLALIAHGNPAKKSAKDNASNGSHPSPTPSQDHKDNQGPPVVPVQGDSSPRGNAKAQEPDESRHLAAYTLWLTAFTAMLFLASVVQGYFLREQASHLQEHAQHLRILANAATDNAKAARDAAEAALMQAATMANAERAWIVERVVFPDQIPRRSPSWDGAAISAVLTLKNVGTQPAILQSVQNRFHTAEQLPDEPQYGESRLIPDGYLLAPGEERLWPCVLEEGSLEDEQLIQIEQGSTLRLYIYGRIIYKSAGVTGISQFCYVWQNPMSLTFEDRNGFSKNGPPAYNKHV